MFKAAYYFPLTPSDSLTSTHASIGRSFSRKKKQVFFFFGGGGLAKTPNLLKLSQNREKTTKFLKSRGQVPTSWLLMLESTGSINHLLYKYQQNLWNNIDGFLRSVGRNYCTCLIFVMFTTELKTRPRVWLTCLNHFRWNNTHGFLGLKLELWFRSNTFFVENVHLKIKDVKSNENVML